MDIKSYCEDWRVYELADLQPADAEPQNPHAYFYVEKTGLNTLDVVQTAAAALALPEHEIGYAGRKDKWGVTCQWFSVPCSRGHVPGWPEIPGTRCLEQMLLGKKLRVGQLTGNRFEIVVRNAKDQDVDSFLSMRAGFANLFGDQRVSQDNVSSARSWILNAERGRKRRDRTRGWKLSVLRAYLFNAVVSKRRTAGLLPTVIEGDVLVAGYPSAPLWGRGRSRTQSQAAELERDALRSEQAVCEALEHAGVNQGRRAMYVVPGNLRVAAGGQDTFCLEFSLPPGSYATTLLNQVGSVQDLGGRLEPL